MARAYLDGKVVPPSKTPGGKPSRKARGEGTLVSMTVSGQVYKVLHAVAKIQGVRPAVLLAQSLESIMTHAGVSLEEVERFLKADGKVAGSKEVRSAVLDRLFPGSLR
jgi:hypothetical protein